MGLSVKNGKCRKWLKFYHACLSGDMQLKKLEIVWRFAGEWLETELRLTEDCQEIVFRLAGVIMEIYFGPP